LWKDSIELETTQRGKNQTAPESVFFQPRGKSYRKTEGRFRLKENEEKQQISVASDRGPG